MHFLSFSIFQLTWLSFWRLLELKSHYVKLAVSLLHCGMWCSSFSCVTCLEVPGTEIHRPTLLPRKWSHGPSFSQPFTCNLCGSLNLKWISCRKYIIESLLLLVFPPEMSFNACFDHWYFLCSQILITCRWYLKYLIWLNIYNVYNFYLL